MDAPQSWSFVVGIVLALVELMAGVSLGWWLRGSRVSGASDQNLDATRDAMARLRELASDVAADVGEHSTQVQAITDGIRDNDAQDADVLVDSMATIVAANERLQAKLKSAEQRIELQAQQLEIRTVDALTDPLTMRANRRAFDQEIARCLENWTRRGTPVALVMADVDRFKKFNDTHGHLAGDDILRGVGQALHASVGEHHLVARYGGEEFAIVLPATALRDAADTAERARGKVAGSMFEFRDEVLSVTLSCGVAQVLEGEDRTSLIERADAALYAAKNNGRNRVYMHNGRETVPLVPPCSVERVAASSGSVAAEGVSVPCRTDVATGLPNRTAFCEEVRRRVAEAQRSDSTISVMMIRVDGWRDLTDRYGDKLCAPVLRTVSQFLVAATRDMDLVASYLPDTFGVILPAARIPQTAVVAERVRLALARCQVKIQNQHMNFTTSMGVAESLAGDDAMSLICRTEEALEASVLHGCNCTHVHDGAGAVLQSTETATV